MNKLIIEKDKLDKNIEIIKGLTQAKIIAVVKGNGYGLGVLEYTRFLSEKGIDIFALSDVRDAVYISESGFSGRVLLLTPTNDDEEAEMIIKNRITTTIGSMTSALTINNAAARLNETAQVHIKIDTGFGRFGFLPDEVIDACTFISTLSNIKVTGAYSHLSFSFSKKPEHIYSQYRKFINSVEIMRQNGIDPGMLHICNSSAFLRFPQMHLDGVRIGSAFLGRIPIENVYGLQRIGFLKSNIIETKELPGKHNIGYANTFKTRNPVRTGIVPVGYRHGFGIEKSRDTFRLIDLLRYVYNDIKSFNKKSYVRIGDKSAQILGRVSMYNIVVDLTDIDAKVGDEVVLDANPLLVPIDIEREFI
ncbi:MAG TPA: alanine racemase [Clostridiales bacterium]|nr:alanine racemase [Clostridiales bacterium]